MQGWEEDESDSQTTPAESCLLQSSAWQQVASLHSMSEPEESGAWQQRDFPARSASPRCSVQSGDHIPSPSSIFLAAVPSPHHIHTPHQQDLSSASTQAHLRSFIFY